MKQRRSGIFGNVTFGDGGQDDGPAGGVGERAVEARGDQAADVVTLASRGQTYGNEQRKEKRSSGARSPPAEALERGRKATDRDPLCQRSCRMV